MFPGLLWGNSLKDRVDCRAVSVLQLLAIIIRLLVLNQSALTLPATREESGLRPVARRTLADLQWIFNRGGFFYRAQCKYHWPGRPRARVCWCLKARYIHCDRGRCWFNARNYNHYFTMAVEASEKSLWFIPHCCCLKKYIDGFNYG